MLNTEQVVVNGLSETARTFAEQNLKRFNNIHKPDVELRLFAQAKAAPTPRKKLFWLQKAADAVGVSVTTSGATVCKRGCNHCCHIAVAITDTEAQSLARSSGRKLTYPSNAQRIHSANDDLGKESEQQRMKYYGVACPFLEEGDCSVYMTRPLACRYQYSLAHDVTPCVIGNVEVAVPFLNTITRQVSALMVLGEHRQIADIRDWFPAVGGDGRNVSP